MDAQTRSRYPRLASYLAGLPAGLASYPECQTKASLLVTLLEGMPQPRPRPSELPEPAGRYLERPPSSMWVPEVEAQAVSVTIADHYHMTDGQYLEWLKDQNRAYLNSLMYRAVFAFLSPAHIVPKAAARWGAVHRGSEMTVRFVGERGADVTLTFPPRLYAGIVLQQITAVLEVVLERSNARAGQVVLAEVSDTRGLYHARW
jgi:hypothetical protein